MISYDTQKPLIFYCYPAPHRLGIRVFRLAAQWPYDTHTVGAGSYNTHTRPYKKKGDGCLTS